jgi:hypothetical protein
MMTTKLWRSLVITAVAFVAFAAHGQSPAAQLVSLEHYDVWCADISIPDGASQAQYYQSLADGVGAIDRTLGTGASTGTPFAARSRRREESVSGDGEKRVDIFSVVTVCTRVSSPEDLPAGGEVYRETRKEVVFVQACPIADRDGCIDRLRTSLAQRLGMPPEDDRVQHLFWRAASSVEEPTGPTALASVLLAANKRRVHVAPSMTVSGNVVAAAELSKPIEQQVKRPLIKARPSWFSVVAQAKDAWLVVAITLTEEMAQKLTSPQP